MSPRNVPTVLARIGGFIVEAARAQGVDAGLLVARTGFDPRAFFDPDHRIPLTLESALWSAAAELANDACFGLHAAVHVRAGAFDALDYVVRTAPDLLTGFHRLARYNRLVHDVAAFRVDDDGARVVVEHLFELPGLAPDRHATDFTLATLVEVGFQMAGERPRPLSVAVSHPAPPDVQPYRDVFGVTPVFDAPVSRIVFEGGPLRRPLPDADPALSRIVTAHADRLLSGLEPSHIESRIAGQVGRLISERLAHGLPTLKDIAKALGTSERSLQRQLAVEGTRFAELVDGVRRNLARAYLADQRLALGEIAYLLGYAEPSPFHRAFKRWTGMTPAEARRRAG